MSTAAASTATPRLVSAAWQAAAALRRTCMGVTIISQKTLQPLATSSKSISWIDSDPDDLGRDQDDGGVVAIDLVQAVDKVPAARAAAAGSP
jgi:hypothetical protein